MTEVNLAEEMYRENILDHYKNPRNFGRLENADRKCTGHNPLCGDELTLYILIEKKKIKDIKFTGKGCAISQASASLLTEKIKGKTIEDLEKLTKDDILKMLAIPVGAVRIKCALLSLDTLKKALFTGQ